MSKLSDNLKNIRKSNKVRQKDIAEFLGVPLRTYQSYEYGEAEPNLDSIAKLAKYLDVSTDYLLGLSDDKKKPPTMGEVIRAYRGVRELSEVANGTGIPAELLEAYESGEILADYDHLKILDDYHNANKNLLNYVIVAYKDAIKKAAQ